MTKPDLTQTELQLLFDAAQDVPAPDPAFLHRLEGAAVAALRPEAVGRDWTLRDLLGGWMGLSGLAAASLVGLWIGIAPPDVLPDPAGWIELAFRGDTGTLDAFSGWEQADWNLAGGDDV